MVKLALETMSDNSVRLSTWEADKPDWTRTVEALSYHRDQFRRAHGLNDLQMMLLCGGDLLESFSKPDIWKEKDVIKLISNKT